MMHPQCARAGAFGLVWLLCAGGFLCAVSASSARAQACARVADATGSPGVVGSIEAAVRWDPDGAGPAPTLDVVAGNFALVAGTAARSVAAFDGAAWRSLGDGLDGSVRELLVVGNDLYAGGSFASSGGRAISSGISVLRGADVLAGVPAWQSVSGLGAAGGFTGEVRALALWRGRLYAGGQFTFVDGLAVRNVARWDGAEWRSTGAEVLRNFGGPETAVTSLAVWNDELFAGGQFNGAPVASSSFTGNVARYDGLAWTGLGEGVEDPVFALASHPTGLVVGGLFRCPPPGVCDADGLALWNGSAWQRFGVGLAAEGNRSAAVADVDVASDGAIWAVGRTVDAALTSGSERAIVARWANGQWQRDEGTLRGFAPASAGSVSELLLSPHGTLVAGGFNLAGSVGLRHAARLTGQPGAAGSVYQPLASGWSEQVWSIAQGSGVPGLEGAVVAGGGFTSAVGAGGAAVAARGLAVRPAGMGNAWQAFAGGEPNGLVTAVHASDGELFIAGGFTSVGGVAAGGVAAWNGSRWRALNGAVQVGQETGPVALVRFGGALHALGTMQAQGGGIGRWNGASWEGLGGLTRGAWPGSGVAGGVFQGELYVAGDFTSAGGVPASGIARWNGTNWSSVAGGLGPTATLTNGVGLALLAPGDGWLYVGGAFGSAGGVPSANVARWNGSQWQAVGDGLGRAAGPGSNFVMSLAWWQGQLVAGGLLSDAARGAPTNSVWVLEGSAWRAVASVDFLAQPQGGLVRVLHPVGDGLLVGGSFAGVRGQPAANLALLRGCAACDSLDFNQDGDFPTPLDVEDFILAVAGQLCATCSNDLDFNNDGDFPTPSDIEAFVRVSAGGPCEP